MSADDGFERAPDGIAPLVGYRIWQVEDENDEPLFLPLNHPSRDWKGATRGWVSASCWVGCFFVSPRGELAWNLPTTHRVPAEGCECGFYAMKELDTQLLHAATLAKHAADRAGKEEVFVLGRVELAGKVIEHELGYRARPHRRADPPPGSAADRRGDRPACRSGRRPPGEGPASADPAPRTSPPVRMRRQ